LLCRVTSSGPSLMGKTQVAVEFDYADSEFLGHRLQYEDSPSRIDVEKSAYHHLSHTEIRMSRLADTPIRLGERHHWACCGNSGL
jgi:hypothetical protein